MVALNIFNSKLKCVNVCWTRPRIGTQSAGKGGSELWRLDQSVDGQLNIPPNKPLSLRLSTKNPFVG